MLVHHWRGPRSFSGAELGWSRLVRLVYLDEAGVSNIDHEPYLVVSGIILDADQDWRILDRHLKHLARKHLPDEDRHGFVFHAQDIWHGSRYFDRRIWPREKRTSILTDLAAIPGKFHLPIVYGFINRRLAIDSFQKRQTDHGLPLLSDKTLRNLLHMSAFAEASKTINFWMKVNAQREVAMLVVENTRQTQAGIKLIHKGISRASTIEYEFLPPDDVLTVEYIVDTVHFASKDESALLQIADMCAFIIKRQMTGKADTRAFFEALRPHLVHGEELDASALESLQPLAQKARRFHQPQSREPS